MKSIGSISSNLLAAALLVGMAIGIYYSIAFLTNMFVNIDAEIRDDLYAFSSAAIFIAILVGLSGRWILAKQGQDQVKIEKAKVYQNFLATLAASPKYPSTKDAREQLGEAEQQLLLLVYCFSWNWTNALFE